MMALRDFRVLRFDSRGHGASEAPAGAYTIEQLADDTLALLDALNIDRCHFVGLSMGGMIGQQLALRVPERLASLMLADTSSFFPASGRCGGTVCVARGMESVVTRRWSAGSPRFRNEHPQEVARIGELIRRTPVAGYIGCAHAIPRINFTEQLATIRCPTRVVVGAEDLGTPVAMARDIADAIPGSDLHVLDGAAHLSNVEQPERFNVLLTTFLQRVSS
jgi:3-oxoadipate enol-lactonase